jgi:hypothetical protein
MLCMTVVNNINLAVQVDIDSNRGAEYEKFIYDFYIYEHRGTRVSSPSAYGMHV